MKFRSLLMWVHLVLGLTAAAILAVVAATGAYITFQDPLTRWLNPVPLVSRSSRAVDVAQIVQRVEERFAPRRIASVEVREAEATIVRLQDRTAVFVHPDSATIIAFRRGRFASLENLTAVMRGLHTHLLLGTKGRAIVTIATLEALLLALTGFWLWWRKKQWKFRPWRGSIFRISWDLHNATGIWFVAPVLGMVVTGLMLAMPGPVYRQAGALPAPWIDPPGSTVPALSVAPLSVARVLAVADSARPGESTIRLSIPMGPRGAFAVARRNETVYVDQFSGAVISIQPDRSPTAGDHAIEAVEQLHTGVMLGIPGVVVMTLGSVMLAVMTITGALLGIKRLLILTRVRSAAAD